MPRGVFKRKRTSTGRRLSTVQQTDFNNLTTRYGTPMSVVVRPTAPPATRGFYGSYSQRGRGELKVIENAPATITPVATAGNIVCYNLIAQGSDFVNRIGRKVQIKSVLFRGSAYPQAVNDESGDIVRVMLVWDTQPNSAGAVPAVTDILTTADVFSGINLNNRDRFKVLWDKRFTQNPALYSAGALTVGNPILGFKEKFIKCNYEQIFSGTGGTIGNIATGSLLMLNVALFGTTSLQHYCRVRFTDP